MSNETTKPKALTADSSATGAVTDAVPRVLTMESETLPPPNADPTQVDLEVPTSLRPRVDAESEER